MFGLWRAAIFPKWSNEVYYAMLIQPQLYLWTNLFIFIATTKIKRVIRILVLVTNLIKRIALLFFSQLSNTSRVSIIVAQLLQTHKHHCENIVRSYELCLCQKTGKFMNQQWFTCRIKTWRMREEPTEAIHQLKHSCLSSETMFALWWNR